MGLPWHDKCPWQIPMSISWKFWDNTFIFGWVIRICHHIFKTVRYKHYKQTNKLTQPFQDMEHLHFLKYQPIKQFIQPIQKLGQYIKKMANKKISPCFRLTSPLKNLFLKISILDSILLNYSLQHHICCI